ncbi:MAG: hypothetical protein E7397_06265 [Ruminococcaceae bacterium]|nr:hypothetical protein [Oscillospiraceae bacterium]
MMKTLAQQFFEINEPYAAGLFEYQDKPQFLRIAHAHKTFLEQAELEPYNGGSFYPCGLPRKTAYAVYPHIAITYERNKEYLASKNESLADALDDEFFSNTYGHMVHTVAGFGFIHSLPHYGRIAAEGFDSYRERVLKQDGAFRDGLLEILDGISVYRDRCIAFLEEQNAKPELIAALRKVPFAPAENIYEALVCWNFVYHLDNCDNVGRLDQDLLPFWKGEDITALLREYFEIVDRTCGFSASIGPDYNGITLQCLKAIKGLRRPQIELRIRPDMPEEYWNAAIEALSAGGTNPSLYNEVGYESSFHSFFPDMPESDFKRFCGVGCTESSLAGISNAGSLDAGIHLPYIFSEHLRAELKDCNSFDEFYQRFIIRYQGELKIALERLYAYHKLRAELRPHPMRSLLVDDCIDKGLDFNNSGARYSWSVINFAGITNLIEDMLAVRDLVFDRKKYSADEFLSLLQAEDEQFYRDLQTCPHYGTDNEAVDQFASQMMETIFDELKHYTTYQGGKHLASSIQFITCVDAGRCVPATPDGRRNGETLADSIAALHSTNTGGATAMLNSVARLPQHKMPGTPVLNLQLEKRFLEKHLKALTLGYFLKGGMQMQISCLSREDMLDAIDHPERHQDLVVRVGGYSEYFVRLPDYLQQQVLSRTNFS